MTPPNLYIRLLKWLLPKGWRVVREGDMILNLVQTFTGNNLTINLPEGIHWQHNPRRKKEAPLLERPTDDR